jgi:hypothetical protein
VVADLICGGGDGGLRGRVVVGVLRYKKGAWDRSVRWGDGGVGLVRLNEMEYGEMGVLDVGYNDLVRQIRSCCVPNKSSTIEAATWESPTVWEQETGDEAESNVT